MQAEKRAAKQLIYETAKQLFLTEGYDIGFRRIANEIGVSQGLITYHFKTKHNLIVEIFKEDYQILSAYLKYAINPEKETLLYVVAFYYLNARILESNPGKKKFWNAIPVDTVVIDAIYASSLKSVFLKLIDTCMLKNEYTREKNLAHLLLTTYAQYGAFGARRDLVREFAPDEIFAESVNLLYYCLGHERDLRRTKDLISQAKQRVATLLRNYPHLLDIRKYLM